jgi:hypothetical protein
MERARKGDCMKRWLTRILVNDKIDAQLKEMFNASSGFPAYVMMDLNSKLKKRFGQCEAFLHLER